MRTPSRTTAEPVEARVKYQLVLQFPYEDGDIDEFDRLVAIETSLIALGQDVDGHDTGSGEFNIFINTNDAEASFASIRAVLLEIDGAKAAYRDFAGDDFTVLWPPGFTNFEIR